MDRLLPHPATLQLLRFQFMAHGLRTWRRLRSPRRLALSALALILAMVWLGQVLLGILMREPADLEKLLSWIPLGLLAYTIWHLLKAACRTPIEPFEWTPAERELLMGAPLRRYDLVMVRLLAIAIAAAAKAACFAIVMVPDLRIVPAGWTGMFLALLFVDLLRMALDITVYGLSRREFLGFRLAVLGTAAVVFSMALVQALAGYDATQVGEFPASLAIPLRVVGALIDLQTTAIGSILVSPFRLFGNVILAQSYSIGLLMMFLSTVGLVALLAGGVVRLEELCRQRRVRGERQQYQQRQCDNHLIEVTASHSSASPLRVPRRWAGAGSLAWRQWLGTLHYRTSLAVAMVVPAVLSCLTLLTPQRGFLMLVQLVGGLVFYSFLLLPTAFKFDFRRDIDRMAVLKALPLSSLMVTCGQLAVPVLLCTVFQLAVLLFAYFCATLPDRMVTGRHPRAAPHQRCDLLVGKRDLPALSLPPPRRRAGSFSAVDFDVYRQDSSVCHGHGRSRRMGPGGSTRGPDMVWRVRGDQRAHFPGRTLAAGRGDRLRRHDGLVRCVPTLRPQPRYARWVDCCHHLRMHLTSLSSFPSLHSPLLSLPPLRILESSKEALDAPSSRGLH